VVRQIGHYPIRVRGTFCGSLANADPAAEWSLVAATLGAQMVAVSAGDERRVAASDFFQGPMTTALKPDELLAEARLPILPACARFGFAEFSRRAGDFAMAMALACAACQPLPDATLGAPAGQPQPMSAGGTQPPSVQPTCSSYTVPLTVGGQPQNAVVEACQQADGSWRVTQTIPGLPPQVYEVPPPAASPYPSPYSYPEAYPYPDFYDWGWGWGGAPWFFGLGPSIVLVQRFNHLHHGFAHAHGFGHGFGRGFGHGFGHGFAGMRGGGMGGGGHRYRSLARIQGPLFRSASDPDPLLDALAAANWPLFRSPEEARYRMGDQEITQRV
jgi:hypothetical protein